MQKPFEKLTRLSKKIHTYHSILSLLHWDQETYMPTGGAHARSEQIAELSLLIHEEKTSPLFRNCLQQIKKMKNLSREQKVMLREWEYEYRKGTKIPNAFVKKFSQLTSKASHVWAQAKKENNFAQFAPLLEEIVAMCREKAAILGFKEHPYDALLEGFEPCMTTRQVRKTFEDLKKGLVSIVEHIQCAKSIPHDFLQEKIEEEKQNQIGHDLLARLPLDPSCIRLDLSSHPFSSSLHPTDNRITTRIIPKAFLSNVFSVLHEAGHSLYEMNLPQEHWGTPLAEAVSLTIHESQSRWWETLVGRSLPFWTLYYPHLQKLLPQFQKIPLDRFYPAMHGVKPSFIRVEADEVTYGLHVVVRFEIEQLLIEGKLKVNEIPAAWNEKMKEYLGITPPDDTQGCLQDIHWSLGAFGYFPTYALGNLAAAQFFVSFEKEHLDWEKKISQGNFAFMRDWLKQHIHRWGKTYNTQDLVKKVTGKSLSARPYCQYLRKKYGAIYGF